MERPEKRIIGFSGDSEPPVVPPPSERAVPLNEEEARFGKPIAGFNRDLPEPPSAEAVVARLIDMTEDRHVIEIARGLYEKISALAQEEPKHAEKILALFSKESKREDIVLGVTHELKVLNLNPAKHGKLIGICEKFLREIRETYQ